MKLITVINKRRSVRCFKRKDRIAKNDIKLILEAAKLAPSARNLQPIEYIIVEDQDIKKSLSGACHQNQPELVPLVIAVIGNLSICEKLGQISSHRFTTSYKGTHVFIYMDTGAAIENMLLQATSLGIDSLWISSFDNEAVAKTLKLPKNYLPLAIVCFGHRLMPPFSPPKRKIEDRLYLNHFKNKQHDFSYLEECKLINEENAELARYKTARKT